MRVQDYLTARRAPFEIVPAGTIGVPERAGAVAVVRAETVAKTALLRADSGFTYVLAIFPANRQLSLSKISHVLGDARVELASEADLSAHCPDCEPGVLPPFGSGYAMETVVDESLAEAEDIIFEGNTHEELIRMKFEDFCRLEEPLVAAIVA